MVSSVYDIMPEPVAELASMGAVTVASPAEVAEKTEIVITMLPDGPEVEQVVTGDNGILDAATEKTVLIDMSSISPTVSIRYNRGTGQERSPRSRCSGQRGGTRRYQR